MNTPHSTATIIDFNSARVRQELTDDERVLLRELEKAEDRPPTPTEIRLQLRHNWYDPIPIVGKIPPLEEWQKRTDTSEGDIEIWAKTWPDAKSTGILCRTVPVLDLDILDKEAAEDVEQAVRERFEGRGEVLVRIGRSPKRAIPFRTDEPFRKIAVPLIAPNGSTDQKIEFLATGQQVVVDGIHPDTKKPYAWFGGSLLNTHRDKLPAINKAEALELVDIVVAVLEKHGYTRKRKKKPSEGNGYDADTGDAPAGWQELFENIQLGCELHDSLCSLGAKLIKSGTHPGAAVNQLRAMMEASTAPHDPRWQDRYDDIPRLVESAVEKCCKPPPHDPALTGTIAEAMEVFDRWLILNDRTPIYAVLGTVAANLLEGDPVWLGVIGPPSSAKTEILNATLGLPKVVLSGPLTVAGLLSGTPKKQQGSGANGGLLRKIGDFGIIALKDFTSVLAMHTETRAEVLAALREIFDGAWTRHIGSYGGRALSWKGKVGLVFACTPVIDSYHGVIGSMGDRFLLSRLEPASKGQFKRALAHVGPRSKEMRQELSEAVNRLFAGRQSEPRPISDAEIDEIEQAILLAVRLRGSIERDRSSREIENINGAEGPARIGLALERLLAGLDVLGVERGKAMEVVKAVALDSVPPNRRRAYEMLDAISPAQTTTSAVGKKLGLPSITVRRILEDLAAYGLIERLPQGQGKADLWVKADWEE
jgi:hypothetical protein